MSLSKSPSAPVRRKVLAGGLALVLAVSVAACGRSSDSSGGDDNGTSGNKSGQLAAAPGFDPATKTITLGVLTPTSTTAKLISDPLTAGNKAFYDQVNASGGIDGKYKVKLEIKDNKYGSGDNTATATAYGQMKDNVVAFQQVLGTDPVHSILSDLKDDNIIAGPATLDAEWYQEPNLMPIMAPYQVEVANGLWYYINKMDGKGKKVCTLTSDDGYGNAGLNGVKFAADKLNVDLVDTQKFKTALTGCSYDAQVQSLQQSKCDAVFLTSLPSDTLGIFNAAISKNFEPMWIGTSPTWINLLAAGPVGEYSAKHYVVAAEGPEWGDMSVPGMKKMLDAVKKYAPKTEPNFYFAFGYLQAMAMSQILTKAVKDGDLSRDGVMKAMNSIGKLTFDGAVADEKYGAPEDREPQRETTIFKVTPDTVKTNGGLTLYADDAMNFTSDVAKQVPLTN
jgi:ABC-type branched-subunit amino acid transport system substrate-binding protein